MDTFLSSHTDTAISEKALEQSNAKLSDWIRANTPTIKKKKIVHELPPFIIRQIKTERQLYREYQRNQCNSLKTKIHIQQMIRKYKTHWLKSCDEIRKAKGRNYWQAMKKLTTFNHIRNISSSIIFNGQTLLHSREMAEAFAHFHSTYKGTNEPNFDEWYFRYVWNWYEQYFNQLFEKNPEFDRATNAELASILETVKTLHQT